MSTRRMLCALPVFVLTASAVVPAEPLSTAFVYQGQIRRQGIPFTGDLDMLVRLFDAPEDGSQKADALSFADAAIVNGLFTLSLDFGANVLTGENRYLEFAVKPAGSPEAYTVLAPRQRIVAAPFSLQTRGIFVHEDTRVGVGTAQPSFDTRLHVVGGEEATAVRGQSSSDGQFSQGVFGQSQAIDGTGVLGQSNAGELAYGIWGRSTAGFAGWFDGKVHVNGTLTKNAGAFMIDHPLDPANRWLMHSFVESPDMKNVYDGVATLDDNGVVVVTLPEWFEALNRDFRYQLTPIGAPAPRLFVAEEVRNNRFVIAGGAPGQRISWQVTGIRRDPYAEAHRIPVEALKRPHERGRFLQPHLLKQPASRGINATKISPTASE